MLLIGGSASADICTDDAVPAATLLLPYFEVDLANPQGRTTFFAIGNADAAPQMVNVVFWTDLGVDTLSFHIYLTGYDIVTVNLRDIFVHGRVPHTMAPLTPAGQLSLPNTVFAGCADPSDLPPGNIRTLQQAHTGKAVDGLGQCFGAPRGNELAVGYITFDNVDECNFLLHEDPSYWGTGGVVNDRNVLWGDFFLVDPAGALAQSESLVSIEASPFLEAGGGGPNQVVPDGVGYTFYGRFVAGTGIDHREPLATTFATRYLNGGPFTGGTDLLVWRDTGFTQEPFRCGLTPWPFPLNQAQIVIFDEEENAILIHQPFDSPGLPGVDILPFPYVVTRVRVGGPELPVPFDFGWLYTHLSTPTGGQFDPFKQAWMAQIHEAAGLFSVGHGATALDDACQPNNLLLPVPGNSGGLPPGGTIP
jgi:hypothetical protein